MNSSIVSGLFIFHSTRIVLRILFYFLLILQKKQVNISDRTDAFITLGKFLQQFSLAGFSGNKELSKLNRIFKTTFEKAIKIAGINNPWFTDEFIRHSCLSISQSLTNIKFNKWIHDYPELKEAVITQKKIGVIMAGNIPLAGFHDMISTIISGHILYGKMSSKDNVLFPVIKEILCHLNPGFNESIFFHESQLKNMDVIIASGSNNSSRYFEYYFGKYPHIIRKNRNSTAIINGDETKES